MPIVPDTKDWTWVLERTCPECGFDAASFPLEELPGTIRSTARAFREQLDHPKASVRPSDERWSCLEYACHVRDVFRLYDYRLGLMLEQDDPLYPNWDQDQTAIEENYEASDPTQVGEQLETAAAHLAASFERVSDDQWARTGRRSDGVDFTIESFARYFIHDPIHHLHDVRLGYDSLESEGK